jgi:hypothetical protein
VKSVPVLITETGDDDRGSSRSAARSAALRAELMRPLFGVKL